jgi:hypothetical protein
MRVSVIISSSNEELLIYRNLDLRQRQDDREEFEIIVVDNRSTNGTAREAKLSWLSQPSFQVSGLKGIVSLPSRNCLTSLGTEMFL